MSGDLISRAELMAEIKQLAKDIARENGGVDHVTYAIKEVFDMAKNAPSVDAEPVITGETSDGYHTFNELYHHRAVLFSVIIKAFSGKAWKAKKHEDGSMYDGMFIVGVETPDGQATYHYDIDPYWEMFKCRELEYAPKWDGHTPQEAIERIGKLELVRHAKWIGGELGYCSACKHKGCASDIWSGVNGDGRCPNCGAKMDGGKNA